MLWQCTMNYIIVDLPFSLLLCIFGHFHSKKLAISYNTKSLNLIYKLHTPVMASVFSFAGSLGICSLHSS
jgi:hypothetical protein